MEDRKLAERIATLEALAAQGTLDRTELKGSIASLQATMHREVGEVSREVGEVSDTLHTMREELARYRGFWGGVLLILSALGTFVGMMFKYVWAKD